ncbi:uncharacterized protein BXZ73DRAFT_76311 [Epithele typhae]|uniref:uncharacterized protein n=1 Tax=Epithele typhae TaxID=378194 RepID=UPI002007B3A5|nr:uncharacterized protein BXZ73DRAFT_76311 [Epithele typhae]KAH9938803.1 hypothetical protein BXZ73DRAFT_76311 [Epithele typhae]
MAFAPTPTPTGAPSDDGKRAAKTSPSDLPPAREGKMLRSVSPPFAGTSLRRFNYALALAALAVLAVYAYRLVAFKHEVGGWWNLALGRRTPAMREHGHGHEHGREAHYAHGHGYGCRHQHKHEGDGEGGDGRTSVESKIEALAAALGVDSPDLARAIGDAVRAHVPPASLSSVAAHEPSGAAVKWLVEPKEAEASGTGGAAEAVVSAFEAAVGLEGPPNDVV